LHGGPVLVDCTGYSPLTLTHLMGKYMMTIFDGLVCCRMAFATRGEYKNYRHMMSYYMFMWLLHVCVCVVASHHYCRGIEFPLSPFPNRPCVPRQHVPWQRAWQSTCSSQLPWDCRNRTASAICLYCACTGCRLRLSASCICRRDTIPEHDAPPCCA
jgi:hypothetical protein